MNRIETQIRELSPSAKEPLFRRLMVDETVSYLREDNGIYGFEVITDDEQTLSGFTIIGVQKHTIYAYCSDLDETPKLILFPPIEKLFDKAFELLDLKVKKTLITDSTFVGPRVGSGRLKDLVKDLTPPEKKIDISGEVLTMMTQQIDDIREGKVNVEPEPAPEPAPAASAEVDEEPQMMDDFDYGYDNFDEGYDNFDEGYDNFDEGYDDYAEEPDDEEYELEDEEPPEELTKLMEPDEDERSTKLKAQTFNALSEVSEYCTNQLHVPKSLSVTLVNKALQSNVSPEYRIDLAIKLFCKLFDTKKI